MSDDDLPDDREPQTGAAVVLAATLVDPCETFEDALPVLGLDPRPARPRPQVLLSLDRVSGWNALYGKAGLVQYQFVVPDGHEEVVTRVLEGLASIGAGSWLGVIKRFGPAGPGHLSFPQPGWTLAVDIPAGLDGVGALLDRCDDWVATGAGRVYLAKDARLRPDLLEAMYPRLGALAEDPRQARPRAAPHLRPGPPPRPGRGCRTMRDATGAVQSILVLGGGSDLGASIAASLCGARHATVILAGRDRAHLERAAAQLRDAGAGRIEMIAFDALDYDSHESVVEQAAGLVGDIDVVVLAFGLLGAGDHLVPGGHTDAVTVAATNYVGAVSTGLAAAGHLRLQGHGTIVVLSSVAAQRVRRANFVYGSSKAGTDGFATGLRAALAGSGVEVLTVRPGWVATAMTRGRSPAPFATTADTVGAATARAFAAHRHTVWVPAGLRLLFLGLRQLPAFIWNRLPG